AGAIKGATIEKLISGHIVPVRPDTELRVIGKLIFGQYKIIKIVSAGRVSGLRDRNRFVIWRSCGTGKCKLADQPAICNTVVQDNGVASVNSRRQAAKRRKETALSKKRY